MVDTTDTREFKRSDSAVAAVAADTTVVPSIEDSDIPTEDIFADDGYGDLTVHVGTPPTQRIFLVDSGVLCAASIKWRAILRHRPSDTPWHLPEDDPEAFRIAMKAAYYRTSEIPNDLSDEVLLSVGALCSKYSLHRVLSHKIVIWEGELAQRALEVRLTAAWDFLLKAEFESAWKDVVKHVVEEEDGGLILRKVPRIQAMPNATPGKSAKNVRRGGRASNKSLRSDTTDEATVVFQQPTGLEEEVFVSRGMLNEEILEKALNQRYECFSALSESYDTILNNISLGFAGTDDAAWDAKRGLVNDSSHPCAQHQQMLFDRLLEIARLKGLLGVGFPMGFKDTLPFDTQNDTLEEFANSIRKEIMLAGRDITCDDVVKILETTIDSVVDGVGLLASELAHFEPKVEGKVTIKRRREGTTATTQTPAPPVAPPSASQNAIGPSSAPAADEDPEAKRQKLDTAAQAEKPVTEADMSSSDINTEIPGQQGSETHAHVTSFDPIKDAVEKVTKDRYQALSPSAPNELSTTGAAFEVAPFVFKNPSYAFECFVSSGNQDQTTNNPDLEDLTPRYYKDLREYERCALIEEAKRQSVDSKCMRELQRIAKEMFAAQASRQETKERIEVAPYVAPEVKTEAVKVEGQN